MGAESKEIRGKAGRGRRRKGPEAIMYEPGFAITKKKRGKGRSYKVSESKGGRRG